jgi:hypothetical protein
MQEIKTLEDLSALKSQIGDVRAKLEMHGKTRLWGGPTTKDAYAAVAAENDRVYADSLSKEIRVSGEMGAVITSLYTDYYRQVAKLDDQYYGTWNVLKKPLAVARLFLKPSVTSLFAVGKMVVEDLANGDLIDGSSHDRKLNEIAQAANKDMQAVLGSYQLTKNDSGDYILKRGEWFEYHVVKDYVAGPGSVSVINHHTGIKNAGVSRDLLPEDLQLAFDKMSQFPHRNPQVGKWSEEELGRGR